MSTFCLTSHLLVFIISNKQGKNWLGTLKNWQRNLDWTGTRTRDLWITVPVLFHLSYPALRWWSSREHWYHSPEVSGSSPGPVKFSLAIFQIVWTFPVSFSLVCLSIRTWRTSISLTIACWGNRNSRWELRALQFLPWKFNKIKGII